HKTNVEAQGTDDLLGLLMLKAARLWWDGKLDSKLDNKLGKRIDRKRAVDWKNRQVTREICSGPSVNIQNSTFSGNIETINDKTTSCVSSMKRKQKDREEEDQDTIKQQRTRGGRNIPDYQEFFEEATDGDESSFQENEEETNEKGLDIDFFEDLLKENNENEPVRDDV
ncbi:17780_t:CDS:2, partial [Acaulospora morrowiae]